MALTLEVGARLGQYRIVGFLGRGGMADVYRAADERLGREVALKALPPEFARDAERVERFRREVRAAARLAHPNIVPVHEYGESDGLHFYTMVLLPGGDLKARVRAHPEGMRPEEALRVTASVARALDYAHREGFVHRDVKPENILFTRDGIPQLTDFGIARATGAGTFTERGLVIGTAHYMSPEQARGAELDGRSDLYSLGIVLYEMLTGRVPFDSAASLTVMYKHLNDPVPTLTGGLAGYQPLLERLLAKSSDSRYASGAAVAEACEALLTRRAPLGVTAAHGATSSEPTRVRGASSDATPDGVLRSSGSGEVASSGTGFRTRRATRANPDGPYGLYRALQQFRKPDHLSRSPVAAVVVGALAGVAIMFVVGLLRQPASNGNPSGGDGDQRTRAVQVRVPSQTSSYLQQNVSDNFTFYVSGPETLEIFSTGQVDTVGRLYRGNVLLESDDDDGVNGNFSIQRRFPAGRYRVEVQGAAGGYTLHAARRSVPADGPPERSDDPPPRRRSGTLTLDVTPGDARVNLVGDNRRYRPGMQLPHGNYPYTVSRPGYISVERSVEVAGRTVVRVTLQRQGTLTFDLTPRDARVNFVGYNREYNPGMHLPHGNYRYTVSRPGYNSAEGSVEVSGPTEAALTLRRAEVGDSRGNASVVGAPSMTPSDLGGSDTDYFRINVSGTGTLVAYTTGPTDTTGTLFRGSNQLASDDDGGDGGNFRIQRRVSRGAYYVRVRGYGGATGAYTLHVHLVR